jgi:hypothetical protein
MKYIKILTEKCKETGRTLRYSWEESVISNFIQTGYEVPGLIETGLDTIMAVYCEHSDPLSGFIEG